MVDLVHKYVLWGGLSWHLSFFVLEQNSLIHMFEFWCQNQMSVVPNTDVKIQAKLPE